MNESNEFEGLELDDSNMNIEFDELRVPLLLSTHDHDDDPHSGSHLGGELSSSLLPDLVFRTKSHKPGSDPTSQTHSHNPPPLGLPKPRSEGPHDDDYDRLSPPTVLTHMRVAPHTPQNSSATLNAALLAPTPSSSVPGTPRGMGMGTGFPPPSQTLPRDFGAAARYSMQGLESMVAPSPFASPGSALSRRPPPLGVSPGAYVAGSSGMASLLRDQLEFSPSSHIGGGRHGRLGHHGSPHGDPSRQSGGMEGSGGVYDGATSSSASSLGIIPSSMGGNDATRTGPGSTEPPASSSSSSSIPNLDLMDATSLANMGIEGLSLSEMDFSEIGTGLETSMVDFNPDLSMPILERVAEYPAQVKAGLTGRPLPGDRSGGPPGPSGSRRRTGKGGLAYPRSGGGKVPRLLIPAAGGGRGKSARKRRREPPAEGDSLMARLIKAVSARNKRPKPLPSSSSSSSDPDHVQHFVPPPTETQGPSKRVYEVEVLGTKLVNGVCFYFVHYVGFPRAYDRWQASGVLKVLDVRLQHA